MPAKNCRVMASMSRVHSTEESINGNFRISIEDEDTHKMIIQVYLNTEQFADLMSTRLADNCLATVYTK